MIKHNLDYMYLSNTSLWEADLEIVQSVSGNFNVILKNFCEKREYIGSKTRNYENKWGYVQRNKVVIVF